MTLFQSFKNRSGPLHISSVFLGQSWGQNSAVFLNSIFFSHMTAENSWSAGIPWPLTQIPDLPVGGAGDPQRGSLLRAGRSVYMSRLHRAHAALLDSRQGGPGRHILSRRSLRNRFVGTERDIGYVGTVCGLRGAWGGKSGFVYWVKGSRCWCMRMVVWKSRTKVDVLWYECKGIWRRFSMKALDLKNVLWCKLTGIEVVVIIWMYKNSIWFLNVYYEGILIQYG